jgi:hypothetical protein
LSGTGVNTWVLWSFKDSSGHLWLPLLNLPPQGTLIFCDAAAHIGQTQKLKEGGQGDQTNTLRQKRSIRFNSMGISMFDFIVSCPAAFKPCVLWTASQLQLVLALRTYPCILLLLL